MPRCHGSLKERKLTSRAEKRLVYTRRFVNVQLTGGKRKVGFPADQGLRGYHANQVLDECQPYRISNSSFGEWVLRDGRHWSCVTENNACAGQHGAGYDFTSCFGLAFLPGYGDIGHHHLLEDVFMLFHCGLGNQNISCDCICHCLLVVRFPEICDNYFDLG